MIQNVLITRHASSTNALTLAPMEFPVAREPNVPQLDIEQSANVQVVGEEIHLQSAFNVSVVYLAF